VVSGLGLDRGSTAGLAERERVAVGGTPKCAGSTLNCEGSCNQTAKPTPSDVPRYAIIRARARVVGS